MFIAGDVCSYPAGGEADASVCRLVQKEPSWFVWVRSV
uniref:Uncharacterized protein n=1 Tax=uncultured bacterium A1Q1_fos_560 TaxID=1256584 RepID=L7VYJ0_9BACT|nr:hypothetical protein [uncultured bacterium A1Q1_fos_560]